MKNLWILLLVCAVAAAAFFLGQRSRPVPTETSPAPAATAAQQEATTSTNAFGEPLSPEPPRTFRGPDGLPVLIAYDVGVTPDSNDRELVKAAVLEDMKNHPRNIEKAYGLTMEEIKDVVEGRKPFPDLLLPKPPAEPPPAR